MVLSRVIRYAASLLDSENNPGLNISPGAWRGEWERLVESIGPASLLVVIQSRLGPSLRGRMDPEDILQESLVRAWRGHADAKFASPRAFRAWVLKIIDHSIKDALRSSGAIKRGGGRKHVAPGSWGSIAAPSSRTPSRLVRHREQAAAMSDAIERVPPDLREVVRLRLFNQLGLEQIASELGLTMTEVRSRLRRGADLYRRRLREAGIGRSTRNSVGEPTIGGPDCV